MRSQPKAPIGYIRDRTALYKEKWNALHPNASAAAQAAAERIGQALGATDTTGLLSQTGRSGEVEDGVAVEMPELHGNRVMATEQKISAALATARAELAALGRLQSAAQQDLFGTNKGQKEQVDRKRAELRESIRGIHAMLNALPAAADASMRPIAERVCRAKATALSEIATELNRQEIQDLQARTHRGIPGMDRSSMDAIFSQLAEPTPAYTQQQMQQLSDMRHEYERRDESVAALIKEVTEIQEVMRDLSVLVVEQGTMVDRIDENISAAAQNIERGAEHIRRAHESSKSGAMAMCIFVLLVAIAIAFVLMLIVKL